MTDILQRIEQGTAKLNALTDTAAAVIREVEAVLPACADCWVTIPGSNLCLGYARHGGRGRVVVAEKVGGGVGLGIIKPWAECAQGQKLGSFEALPKLIDTVGERLASLVMTARDVVQQTREFLDRQTDEEPN